MLMGQEDGDDEFVITQNHYYDLDPDFNDWEFVEEESDLVTKNDQPWRRELLGETEQGGVSLVRKKKSYPRNLAQKKF